MKYSRIKSIITHILEREFNNEIEGFKLEYRLPNPKTADFLALVVARQYSFDMFYHHERGVSKQHFRPLILHKKGKEWYLGNYYEKKKKHFSNFEHFYAMLNHYCPLYFVGCGNNLYLPQFITQKPVFESISDSIAQINLQNDYYYDKDFIELLARFANTDCKLKIIVADCEGDFYVTHSRIWSYNNVLGNMLQMDNIRRNVRFPNEINWGAYLTLTTKIVQVSYKSKVLFSTEAFTEEHMKIRKDFKVNMLIHFAKMLKEEQENTEE